MFEKPKSREVTLFYIANWPSLIFDLYPVSEIDGRYNIEAGFFNPLVMTVNAVGWGIIGFIVGFIISLKRPDTTNSLSKLRREIFSDNRDIRITVYIWIYSLLVVTLLGFNHLTFQMMPAICIVFFIIQFFMSLSTLLFPIIVPLLIMESTIHLVRDKKRKDYLNLSQRVVLWCVLTSTIFLTIAFLIFYFTRP
ncbi:hypothetical protein JW879_00015 [candidate division WOR-3 bacterium]|nr:hypothetical protein [candidate division WOR-3 bacterium]